MSDSVKKLIKDLLIAVITGVVFYMFDSIHGADNQSVFFGVVCAGFWFGWKAMSNAFVAWGWVSLLIKVLLAIFIGWILMAVQIVKDIVAVVQDR